MQLTRAKLINVCQHKNRDVQFGPGLTIICGPNGAGKSNLMAMVRLSITNDFASIAGTKEECVNRLCTDQDVSYIETTWKVAAGELIIRRVLQGGKSSLSLNGVEFNLIRGREREITEQALKLMGVTARIVDDFLFASQERLQDVIGGTKAKRGELFQSLCGLDHLAAIDKYLREAISAEALLAGNFSEDELARSQARWVKLKSDYLNARNIRDKAIKSAPSQKDVDDLHRKLRLLETIADARTKVRQAKDREKYALTQLEGIKRVTEETLSEHTAQQVRLSSKVTESRELLATAETYQRLPSKADVEKALAVSLDTTEPAQPTTEKPSDEQLQDVVAELTLAKAAVKSLEEKLALKICPTCASELTPKQQSFIEQDLRIAQKKVTAITKIHDKMTQVLSAWRQWESDVSLHKKTVTWANSTLANVKAAGVNVEDYLSADVDDLLRRANSVSEEIDDLTARLETSKFTLDRLRVDQGSKEEAVRQALADQSEYQRIIDDNPIDFEDTPQSLGVRREQYANRINDVSTTSATAASLANELNVERGRLSLLRREKARLVKSISFKEKLTACRKVVGRDRLQARIIGSMLRQTTDQINEYLKKFALPFTVDVDQAEFSFIAHHQDGTHEQATRLSVGQKLALAIAFWLARSTVFNGRIPFFCLDEPTAHLDEERVVQCASVFANLAAELEASGRQGIVITHHSALAAAGTVVEIRKET